MAMSMHNLHKNPISYTLLATLTINLFAFSLDSWFNVI